MSKTNKSTGLISNRRVAIDFGDKYGYPDGMCMNASGHLWIAYWGTGRVIYWDSIDSRLVDEIILPVIQVILCAFGGADYTDLYITSARHGLNANELKEQPFAGRAF